MRPGAPDEPARRLRVLLLTHLFPLGPGDSAGVFVREQTDALAERADVTVVVGRYGPVDGRDTAGTPRVVELSLSNSPHAGSPLAVAAAVPRYYRQALRAVRSAPDPFDVIHAHYGFPDGFVGILLGRALAVPVVLTMHGSDFEHQLARPVIGPLLGRFLSHAGRIVAVGPHIAEGMRARFGLGEDRVVFLPNGYNEREISRHAERTPRHLLFVGALAPRKNPDILLDAYASVADRVPLDLVLVGDGPMRGELERRAARLGVASRVRFEGERPHAEIDEYLAEAAALVLPSSREGMPIVVNEALASGTPVVASRLPGTERQVRDERFGYLVPPGDVAALADALVKAAESVWDHRAIAEDCGVPSWSEYADRLLALYAEVIPTAETTGAEAPSA